jgi:RHH-type proline utilization regulon transcriptional repressor/proline dehydrogenase/delta 1-pyrroline-5-carboxylate dehydrogenase
MPESFSREELAQIESATQRVGRYLFSHVSTRHPTALDRRWWEDRILDWAMRDESVKVQMFRFVDVLPMLTSGDQVMRHLDEYLRDVAQFLPSPVRFGLAMGRSSDVVSRAMAMAARRNVMAQARRFIAGSNPEEMLAAAMRQRKLRRAFTIDVLGEAVTSQREADAYLESYCRLIQEAAPVVNGWPEKPQIDRGPEGPIPRVNVSVKLTALDSQFDPIDPIGTTERVASRLRKLLRVAREHGAFVNIDMESYQVKDLTLRIFQHVFMEDEFRETSDVGIVIQCYLKDAPADLLMLRDWAKHRGTPVWVRAVKGAYWDYETVHARALGWPVPVYERKRRTDANFEQQVRFMMKNHAWLRPAVASHNLRSLAHTIAVAEHLGLSSDQFELQMLYGMGDAEKDVLVEMGHRLRVYMPYGALIPGMAYLVRRLLENTSNDSFLRATFNEGASPERLLMNPMEPSFENDNSPESAQAAKTSAANRAASDAVNSVTVNSETVNSETVSGNAPHSVSPRMALNRRDAPREPATSEIVSPAHEQQGDPMADFVNEPPTDFSIAANREALADAVKELDGKLGRTCPLIIDGHAIETPRTLESRNPSHKHEIVGRISCAVASDVDRAVQAAFAAWPDWAALDMQSRAVFLHRAADAMREKRFELAAWIIRECGKPWRDADGDVAEAIDFCEYYARGARVLEEPSGRDVPGEQNRLSYMARGVVGVIAPWNFPLAILTGMTVAALVTGNTVIMKPAEQSSVVGFRLMEIFLQIGLPPGVVQFVSGQGEEAGAALVQHPMTSMICFTGSRQVGLSINQRAAELSALPGARGVKRVVAEMGGKNAIIIDEDADLDEAVVGVVQSAFGYQGQKCSACSRLIVLDAVHDALVERLVQATDSLVTGPAEDPGTKIGPVIDADALSKIKQYVECGKQQAVCALAGEVGPLADEGYYVGPHIFTDVDPQSTLAQEEIFGPVLAVMRAKDLDQAFRIANSTDYALTGGIYSRSPSALQRARREFVVGNLYLNRPITGALVGRQPFGGFRMSGIGSKAGGPDYLYQFVIPRTVTENTMRRGFAPASVSKTTTTGDDASGS